MSLGKAGRRLMPGEVRSPNLCVRHGAWVGLRGIPSRLSAATLRVRYLADLPYVMYRQ